MLQSTESQRDGHDLVTEQQQHYNQIFQDQRTRKNFEITKRRTHAQNNPHKTIRGVFKRNLSGYKF